MATGSSKLRGSKNTRTGERAGGEPTDREQVVREPMDREQRTHPPPERLAAYLAEELPELEGLREHLATCAPCARLVLDLDRFEELQPPDGHEPVTEAEMKDAWKDLRRRLDRDSD